MIMYVCIFVDISGLFPAMKGKFMRIHIYVSIYTYTYGCISIWDEQLDHN